MADLQTYVQKNISQLQRYIFATNKTEFLDKQVVLAQDKKFFDILLNPYNHHDKSSMVKAGLSHQLAEQINSSKLMRQLKNAKTEEEKKNVIKSLKEQFINLRFDYPKPADFAFASQQQGDKKEETNNSRLQTEKTIKDVVTRALSENPLNIAQLSEYGLKNIPIQTLGVISEKLLERLFSNPEIIRSLDPKFTSELFRIIRKKQELLSTNVEDIVRGLEEVFNSQQIEEICKEHKFYNFNYFQRHFKLKYQEKLQGFKKIQSLSFSEKLQKIKLCRQIIKEVQESKTFEFKHYFVEQLERQILFFTSNIANSDLAMFIRYLENVPAYCFSEFNIDFRKKLQKQQSTERKSGLAYLDSCNANDKVIIAQNIASLLKANSEQTIQKLSPYIQRQYLIREDAKIKLAEGRKQEIKNLLQIFSANELNDLRDHKEITIAPQNKTVFRIDDPVVIKLKLKNIKELCVKVYNINLEQNYLDQAAAIDDQINLKYLVAQKQAKFEIQCKDPYVQTTKDININQYLSPYGFFIVEFESEAVTSRAVIKRGLIIHENKVTSNGHEITFYDQRGSQINELSVWRNNKKIEVKDKLLIPFGPQASENIIAVYQQFAQQIRIYIQPQQYSFNIDYIYTSETFAVGSKAKIILHPTVKVSEQYLPLSRLRNVSITTLTLNNKNISASNTVSSVKFRDDEDYVLQVPIKSYIKSISINVKAEVQQLNKQKTTLQSTKLININLEEQSDNFIDFYLLTKENEYVLSIRGKNGETIDNAQAIISYEPFGGQFSFSKTLLSDQNGQVQLGTLEQVRNITAKVNSNSYSSKRTWSLNDYSSSISYGGQILGSSYGIYLKEGQKLSLPVPANVNIETDVVFLKQNNVTNCRENKIKDIWFKNGRVETSKLQVGVYTLILLKFGKRISIEVVKGKTWIGDKLIDAEDRIYNTIKKQEDFVCLGELKRIEQNHETKYEIEILSGLEKLPDNFKIHAIAKNYIDSVSSSQPKCAYSCPCPPNLVNRLELKQSTYYSNKTLSDETSYILNRRNQLKSQGNNLEKPHIFLKRIEVRSTQQKPENLKKQGVYKAQQQLMDCAMNFQSKCMPRSAMCFDMQGEQMMRGGFGFGDMPAVERGMNAHNNFLKTVGLVKANLKKAIISNIPPSYNLLQVYLVANNFSIKRIFALNSAKIETLNLAHNAIRVSDEKSSWTMSRQIYSVLTNGSRQISRSSDWSAVSISNIIAYAKDIGIVLPEWLQNWNNYNDAKKLEVYDKEACHQLNFFLSKKDHPFFKKVVLPFIQSKLHKTVVDLYFLDREQILQYAHAHLLSKLNYFQRALLAEKLYQFGKKEEAKNLALALELPLKNNKQSPEQYKQFFETILNAKKTANLAPKPSFSQAALFGGVPPPPPGQPFSSTSKSAYAPPQISGYVNRSASGDCDMMLAEQEQCKEALYDDECDFSNAQQAYKPGFKQTEKTKQYTETTYQGLKNPAQSIELVPASLFWAELALHKTSPNGCKQFLSDKFRHLKSRVEFILACSVLSGESEAKFELESTQNSFTIKASAPFLLFVREIKLLPIQKSKAVVINQRFYDPKCKFSYEDGQQVEKDVDSFIYRKPFTLQTIITNISGTPLEIQLLIDIPEGSIPLLSHQQTQINNVNLAPYTTVTFDRSFYFPSVGCYQFFPANASRGSSIIATASAIPKLQVLKTYPVNKNETLQDILRSGNEETILNYLSTKNIFDWAVFNINLILWKFKERSFYDKAVSIFKSRNYFNQIVWSFAIYHDIPQLIAEFFESRNDQLGLPAMDLPIFQYYPYYSSRTHKMLNENKSTILVKQFKDTYAKFLYAATFEGKLNDPKVKMTLIYYLILQDRIEQALTIYDRVTAAEKKQFKLQYDYLDCFIEMQSSHSDYSRARNISQSYLEYPVISWRKLFNEVYETLTKVDDVDTEASLKSEKQAFSATVVNTGKQIKITVPVNSQIIVNFYPIDLELYFSEFPFKQVTALSTMQPAKTWRSGKVSTYTTVSLPRSDYSEFNNVIVQVHQCKQNTPPAKLSNFLWSNPEVKVKINEKEGTLKVFYGNKKCSLSYVKVYCLGATGQRFYRDGYTDISSTFRYALDLKDVKQFSILVLTEYGGSVHQVNPPSLI